MHIKPKQNITDDKETRISDATSKLEETVKEDDGWLLLRTSRSDILPEHLAISL